MYWHILRRLSDAAGRKCAENGEPAVGIFCHDYAPAHGPVLMKDFLAESNVTTVEYPLYLLTWLQLIFTCFLD